MATKSITSSANLPLNRPVSIEEYMPEINKIKQLISPVFSGQEIDVLIQDFKLKKVESFKEHIKIPLLRALLKADQGSDDFFNYSFTHFAGIVSVFKCVYQIKKELAKSELKSLEIIPLQSVSRCLIQRKRYDEAIEVSDSISTDHEDALLMVVENLADAQAINKAKSAADRITSFSHKKLARTAIEESDKNGVVIGYNDKFPEIVD